jgi:hypothetical protein
MGAFENTGLTAITIPESVETIGYWTFAGCTGAASAIIGDGVKVVGNYAFQHCTSLAAATIGASVEYIGDYAFHDCISLGVVVNRNPVPQVINPAVFTSPNPEDDKSKDTPIDKCTLHVPSGSEELYKAALVWRDFKIKE